MSTYVRVVRFGLDGITHDEYEQHCRAVAPVFAHWPGLLTKVWLADRRSGTYGGVYLFASQEDAARSRDTEVFAGMLANPHFTDVEIVEYETISPGWPAPLGPVLDGSRR